MNILRVRCRNLEEFEEHYLPDVPNGGVFCPTTTELSAGTPVVVEMACDGLPNKVLIRGTVTAWRPALPRMRVRAGATVAFEADESAKRDFVIQTLRGERPSTRRRKHTRIPIGIPCKIRIAAGLEAIAAELREISVSGGLILGPLQPPIGTDVVVEIT
ncbi:MAG TPA: PilZ domain-containing protein, partial [Polyangia bacterium]|nr:PilZ domain-containing protein [Polyangia bacterium]